MKSAQVAILLLAVGCGQNAAKSTEGTPAVKPGNDLTNVAADFSMDANAYAKEFQKDESAANKRYEGKVIELSGVIRWVMRDVTRNTAIHLKAEGGRGSVTCYTADSEPWESVLPTQTVKVKGKCRAGGMTLFECVVVESGPSPTIAQSARQIATDYAANPEEFTKKFDNTWFTVTGQIAEVNRTKLH